MNKMRLSGGESVSGDRTRNVVKPKIAIANSLNVFPRLKIIAVNQLGKVPIFGFQGTAVGSGEQDAMGRHAVSGCLHHEFQRC